MDKDCKNPITHKSVVDWINGKKFRYLELINGKKFRYLELINGKLRV